MICGNCEYEAWYWVKYGWGAGAGIIIFAGGSCTCCWGTWLVVYVLLNCGWAELNWDCAWLNWVWFSVCVNGGCPDWVFAGNGSGAGKGALVSGIGNIWVMLSGCCAGCCAGCCWGSIGGGGNNPLCWAGAACAMLSCVDLAINKLGYIEG